MCELLVIPQLAQGGGDEVDALGGAAGEENLGRRGGTDEAADGLAGSLVAGGCLLRQTVYAAVDVRVDGRVGFRNGIDDGKGYISLSHGDRPTVNVFATQDQEAAEMIKCIREQIAVGIDPREICVVARTNALVDEYKATGQQDQVDWLLERWPEGKYQDVIGLCKVAKLDGEDGIIDQDYSLNAGRYVGVVIEDDGMTESEFRDTMKGLHSEFSQLNDEALALQAEIDKNMKELFGEE